MICIGAPEAPSPRPLTRFFHLRECVWDGCARLRARPPLDRARAQHERGSVHGSTSSCYMGLRSAMRPTASRGRGSWQCSCCSRTRCSCNNSRPWPSNCLSTAAPSQESLWASLQVRRGRGGRRRRLEELCRTAPKRLAQQSVATSLEYLSQSVHACDAKMEKTLDTREAGKLGYSTVEQ